MKKILLVVPIILALVSVLFACGSETPTTTMPTMITTTPTTKQDVLVDPPVHEHSYTTKTVEPTCREMGYTIYVCECGYYYEDDYVDSKGHNWEIVAVTNPNCTEQGYTTYSCDVCGASLDSDYTDPLGHQYDAVVTKPTCTEGGYTSYTCNCGDSYVDDYTQALGHSYGNWIVEKEATKTEDGKKYKTCSGCGDIAEGVLYATGSLGLEYCLSSDGLSYSVQGIGTCQDDELIIPSYYKDLPVTTIANLAFQDCTVFTSVIIGNSVTSIEKSAFLDCSLLVNVTISDSVTSIGACAFCGCSSLVNVKIPSSVKKIGEYPFGNCDSIINIEVDKNNEYYKSIDGNLYSKDGKTMIQYAKGKQETSFIIPDTVTVIEMAAFLDCDSLKSITIPDTVTEIRGQAFLNCSSLTNAIIGNSVRYISAGVFQNCTSLINIHFNGSIDEWNTIEFSPLIKWNAGVPATEVICSNGNVSIE